MVFSCHYAQGLVDLEMLSYQYITSHLVQDCTWQLIPLATDHTVRTDQAHLLPRWPWYPWRINASAAGGHSTQKVFRGSSCWPLQWVLLFLSFQSLSPTVAGNTMTSIWKTTTQYILFWKESAHWFCRMWQWEDSCAVLRTASSPSGYDNVMSFYISGRNSALLHKLT